MVVPPGVEGAMAPMVTEAVGDVWGHGEAASRSMGLPGVWAGHGVCLQGLGPREQGTTAGNPELTCPGADRTKVQVVIDVVRNDWVVGRLLSCLWGFGEWGWGMKYASRG